MGKFKSGQSGNPSGRPQGSLNRATLASQALLDGEAEVLTRKVVELAKDGKVGAIDPVVQILIEEEERAGVTLAPEQRTAILKILRELVSRDVRSIRELIGSMQGGKKTGEE